MLPLSIPILALAIILFLLFIIFIYEKPNVEHGEVTVSKKKNRVFPSFNKKQINNTVKEFESTNGNKLNNFSIKEIVLLLHKEVIQKCDDITLTIDEHKQEREKQFKKISEKVDGHISETIKTENKFMHSHDLIIQEITDKLQQITEELPEKGFCEKIKVTLWPEPPALPLDQKVELIWHERRILKYLIEALIAVGIGNIILMIMGMY